jgi:hypothetical protein
MQGPEEIAALMGELIRKLVWILRDNLSRCEAEAVE